VDEPKSNLDSLFEAAVEIKSAKERAEFLDKSCGEDRELRSQLERLLLSHEQAGSFLEKRPAELGATIAQSERNRDASLDAGLAAAFGQENAVVIGSAGHSVLKAMDQTIAITQVVLRDAAEGDRDPIVRPHSREMPPRDSDSRYRLDGEIARGGMGAILKGRDTDLGRDLAIKVLLDQHKDKPDVVQRFIEEAQIGGQLQHPGIAPIYELGQFADKRPFFAMKLVKGETLSKLLADREEPTAERAKFIGIFEQICQTMAYAHSRGVIHRDLKPANIMVGAFGEVQVMDWGLAKVLTSGGIADEKKAHERQHGQSSVHTLGNNGGSDTTGTIVAYGSRTQMGSVMGTPAYMPPEQALGEIDILDERADVFGLGAILCEILTGHPPYVAEDAAHLFRMAARGNLRDCLQRLDDCGADRELISLAKHCLELKPTDRPRDAGVLASRVTDYIESVETKLRQTEVDRAAQTARAESESQRVEQQKGSARRLRAMLAGLAVVAVIAGAASIVAGRFWYASNLSRLDAEDNLAYAQRAGQEASAERDRADKQAQVGNLRLYYAQMHQAQQVWRENQGLVSMRGILSEWLPRTGSSDRRGWEWFYLNSLPFQNQDTLRASGPSTITVVAWHQASNRLAEGTADGLIRIWDVGRQRTTLTLSGSGPAGAWWGNRWLNWSPDGNQLVAGFNNGDVQVWETSSGRNLGLFRGHKTAIMSVAYSSDGSRIAAWGSDGAILVWDANTGELNSEIAQPGSVLVGSWSPDDKFLACGHADGSVTVGGTHAGEPFITLRGAGSGSILDLAWSPDSRRLATTNADEMAVRIWDVASEKMVVGPLRHTHGVLSLEWDSDGQKLAAGDMAYSIKIWNTTTGSLDLALRGNTSHPTSLAWGQGSRLATGCGDGALKIYETTSVQEARILPGQGDGVLPGLGIRTTAVAWSPDGKRLVSGCDDGRIRIWDPVARTVVLSIDGHDVGKLSPQFGLIRSLAWSSDGKRVASGGLDGRVRVWEARDGSEAFALPDDRGPVWSVAWSPDGSQLAASYQDGTIRIVEGTIATSAEFEFQAHEPLWVGARTLAWNPKGDSLASGGADGLVKIWDPTVGGEQGRIQAKGAVFSVAWSPDGNRVASTDGTALVTTWDAKAAIEISTLRSHSSWVDAVVWSPDGTRLASCGLDNTVRISDPNLGEETLVLRGDKGWFHDISWHPDGAQIAAASSDGQIWIWDATRGYEKDTTRRALPYIERKVASGSVSGEDRSWFVESYIRGGKLKEALALLMKSEQDKTGRMLRAKVIDVAATTPGLIEKLAESAVEDGQFQAELALHFADKGDVEQAKAARGAARKLFEQQRTKEPGNSYKAGELADLLIQINSGEWTTIRPEDVGSVNGAELTVLDDDSILASGANIDGDLYRISATAPLDRIAAIRLEVLPEASLPSNGPGRHESGNFHLREFRLFQGSKDTDDKLQPVPLANAWTSYVWNAPDTDILGTIDPGLNKYWHVWGRTGEAHQAVFCLREPVHAQDRLFLIELRQSYNLGRFRLSVSASPFAYELEAMKFNDTWAKLAAAYRMINDQPSLDKLLEQHPEAVVGIGDLYAAGNNWERAVVEYSKSITDGTADSALLAKRAAAYMATQNWDLARADWQRIVAQQPDQNQAAFEAYRIVERWNDAAAFGLNGIDQNPKDTIAWLRVAAILALNDAPPAYTDFCSRMVQHFADSTNPETAERVVKACLLRADSIDLTRLPEDQLAKALDNGTVPDWLPPWGWGSRALLAYRRGDSESAVKYVAKSKQHTPLDTTQAMNMAVLAMAQHQLGNAVEAKTALEEALQMTTRLKGAPGTKGDHDLLIAEILFREADALMNEK
jgi:WD40 repeat protein/serine/threonine protein kinase/tetratricopeptide (TPR) repeat protein